MEKRLMTVVARKEWEHGDQSGNQRIWPDRPRGTADHGGARQRHLSDVRHQPAERGLEIGRAHV